MKILHAADFHLGNYQAKASVICDNIRKHIYPLLKDIDMFVLAGDLFDRGLAYDAEASRVVTEFLLELCSLSKQHGFLIRVLRGTWSHDRNSVKILETIAKAKGVTDTVKYVDIITIEYIEKFDKSIIYIPDDVPFNELESKVISRIKDTKSGIVDIAIFHGMMKHVLPPMPREPINTINANNWFKYIKYVCLCGHIHQKSIFRGKFVYSGSFDRLCHGDEGTKGFFIIEILEDKPPTIKFIENTDAYVFKSLDLNNKSFSDGISYITDSINKFNKVRTNPDKAIHIRILINDIITKSALMSYCSEQYKSGDNIKITYKTESLNPIVEEDEIEEDMLIVTPETLAQLINDRIDNELSVNEISDILNKEM